MATVNSARSNFRDVITVPRAADGLLLALANVEFHVLVPGGDPAVGGDHVNVYGSRNPADLSPLPQPIITDATAIISVWGEPGEYDIFMHDRNAPSRIADQRFGWSAISPVDKGIPSGKVRDDGALVLDANDSATMRQFAPLGSVLDWWRPSSAYDAGAGAGNPPPGYEICDGRVVAAGANDITPGVALTLPDLRGKFIMGADILKADGAASVNGDGSAAYNAQHPNAPGIRGGGGANASRNLQHSHQFGHTHGFTAPDHAHAVTGVDHLHGSGSIYASATASRGGPNYAGGAAESPAFTNHIHAGTAGSTAAADRSLNSGTGFADRSLASSTSSQSTTTTDNGTASATADMRPAHYGLLKIMKVRRS